MTYEEKIQELFNRVCKILNIENIKLKSMQRRGVVNTKKPYSLGHTNLKNKTVTIDIFTPKFRRPKSINSILRVLAHEITHHQKPSFRQRWQGRVITRQHYPAFYRKVNKNIEKLKKDKLLGQYFQK